MDWDRARRAVKARKARIEGLKAQGKNYWKNLKEKSLPLRRKNAYSVPRNDEERTSIIEEYLANHDR